MAVIQAQTIIQSLCVDSMVWGGVGNEGFTFFRAIQLLKRRSSFHVTAKGGK